MKITDKTSQNTSRTYSKDGYLIVPATLSRVGIFEYHATELGIEGNDIKRIKRSEHSLFSDTTIKSFEGVPITLGHPDTDVTAENWKKLAVGNIRNVKRDGEYLQAEAWIYDKDAITAIENHGVEELSCGYSCDTVPLKDTQEADFEFTPMIGNHVAIVANGRCGSSCKLADHNKETVTMNKQTLLERILSPFGIKLSDEQIKQLDADEEEKNKSEQSEQAPASDKSKEKEKASNKDENIDDEKDDEKHNSSKKDALIAQLQAENKAIKKELNTLKDSVNSQLKEAKRTAQIADAKANFKSVKLADNDSVRDIQEKCIISTGLCDTDTLKALSDEAVSGLYAGAKKIASSEQSENIGKALIGDKKTITNDLNRYKS